MDKADQLLDELFGKDPAVKRLLSPTREELNAMEESLTTTRRKYELEPTNPNLLFQYASLLISHSRDSYINEGVILMESLVYAEWQRRWGGATHSEMAETDRRHNAPSTPLSPSLKDNNGEVEEESIPKGEVGIVATAPPDSEVDDNNSRKRQVTELAVHYYYLAVGWVKLRDYDKALTCVKQMLRLEPNHRQGVALQQYIEAVVRRTLATTGIAGLGVVAAVSAFIGIILSRR